MTRHLAAVGPLLGLGLLAGCACGDDEICRVAGGRYHAMVPAGWDGQERLPVILSVHGYGGSPDSLLSKPHLGSAYDRAGVLWVVPEGQDRSWKTRNSPETGDVGRRNDVEFLGAVLDDVAERWPIDQRRVAASGFSQGGSMASELACLDPDRWPVSMPISGTFWTNVPARCRAPVSVRHTHGTADPIWPLEGRAIGAYDQGGVDEAMEVWGTTAGCDPTPTREQLGELVCAVYTGCGASDVRLCLHDGGHTVMQAEADQQLRWLGSLGWW